MKRNAMTALVRSIGALALITTAAMAQADEYRHTRIEGVGALNDPQRSTHAVDVNAGGQVVGYSEDASGVHSFIYQAGNYTLLTGAQSWNSLQAASISDDGTVVGDYYDPHTGSKSFIYSGGQYETFALPGAEMVTLSGISPNGRYLSGLGVFNPADGLRAFSYDRQTSTWKLVPRRSDAVGGYSSGGINDQRMSVGTEVVRPVRFPSVSFVYDSSSGARVDYPNHGWNMLSFSDISNRGQLVGSRRGANGLLEGFIDRANGWESFRIHANGSTGLAGINDEGWLVGSYAEAGLGAQIYGFVSVPVPEPATWGLMLGGLAFVGWRARRRG